MEYVTYFSIWIIVSLCMNPSLRTKNYMRYRQVVGGIIYVFFSAFRDIISNKYLDAYAYYVIFNSSKGITLLEYFKSSTVEPGYSLIAWLIGNTIGSYTFFLIIVHIFIYCSYCYFVNKLPVTKRSVLPVSIICLDLLSALYLQRNIIAVGFALIMFVKIYDHKFVSALGILLCATSVHFSAIILFPILIYFWLSEKTGIAKSKIVLYELLLIVLLVLIEEPLFTIFSGSDKYSVYENTGSIAVVTNIFAGIIMIIFLKKLKIMNKKGTFITTLGVSLFNVILIIPLQLQFSIMYRMILFFLPIMITVFFYTVKEYKGLNYYLLNAIMLIYSGYRISSFFIEELNYIGIPYKLYLGGL